MRRWRILLPALAAVLAAGLLAGAVRLFADGARVTYDETILQGDAADFAGVTVQTRNRMGFEVFWETAYRPGTDDTARSRMVFGGEDRSPVRDEPKVEAACYLLNEPEGRSDAEADALVEAVAARTPEGGALEEVHRAADWYEYFPLSIRMDSDVVVTELRTDLQIPVPDDFQVRVSVWGHEGARFSFTVREASGAGPTLRARSAGLREGDRAHCWFALDTGSLDTSRLPGGGGVLELDSEDRTVACAYPLPAGTRVCDLWLSEDQDTLCVLHSLDGAHTLTTLSVPDMTVRQTLALPIAAEAALSIPLRFGDLALVPASDNTLTVLAPDGGGRYAVQAQADRSGDPALEPPPYFDLQDMLAADFSGGRLVLARQQFVDGDPSQDMDLILSVYGADGRRSTMVSRCSLAAETLPERYYHGRNTQISPCWDTPLAVTIG